MKEMGELFGWLIVISFIGALLNYGVKFANRKFGKQIASTPQGKNVMKILMTVFVQNHKYFGLAAFIFLCAHFLIQFSNYGINLTGGMVALLMFVQVGWGLYGARKKKARKSVWFITHRILAILIISGILIHLTVPYALNTTQNKEATYNSSQGTDISDLPVFTLEELSKYNGTNNEKIYVAYQGMVYDVTDRKPWAAGKHNGQVAGTDLTDAIGLSPHGEVVFKELEVVGTLETVE